MPKDKSITDCIIEGIENIVNPKIKNAPFDKTFRAKVIQVNDDSCVVQINGINYNVGFDGSVAVGQIVKVKAPLNNFSDIYIEQAGGSASSSIYIGNTEPTLASYTLWIDTSSLSYAQLKYKENGEWKILISSKPIGSIEINTTGINPRNISRRNLDIN